MTPKALALFGVVLLLNECWGQMIRCHSNDPMSSEACWKAEMHPSVGAITRMSEYSVHDAIRSYTLGDPTWPYLTPERCRSGSEHEIALCVSEMPPYIREAYESQGGEEQRRISKMFEDREYLERQRLGQTVDAINALQLLSIFHQGSMTDDEKALLATSLEAFGEMYHRLKAEADANDDQPPDRGLGETLR